MENLTQIHPLNNRVSFPLSETEEDSLTSLLSEFGLNILIECHIMHKRTYLPLLRIRRHLRALFTPQNKRKLCLYGSCHHLITRYKTSQQHTHTHTLTLPTLVFTTSSETVPVLFSHTLTCRYSLDCPTD